MLYCWSQGEGQECQECQEGQGEPSPGGQGARPSCCKFMKILRRSSRLIPSTTRGRISSWFLSEMFGGSHDGVVALLLSLGLGRSCRQTARQPSSVMRCQAVANHTDSHFTEHIIRSLAPPQCLHLQKS
jgi:hypothetical protein